MWLDNELSLFKQNIEMLRVNQRIGRLAFLWAVLGLMGSKFLAYLLFVVLIGFIQDGLFQGSTYLSYIYFGCLQIIHVIASIFILKRRLNDCGSSLWYMILVPIAYLSLWVYWGMSSAGNLYPKPLSMQAFIGTDFSGSISSWLALRCLLVYRILMSMA